MSYIIDEQDENAIVFSGHSDGIAESPYEGISDMRNVNIISIPNEASVNFATSKISPPTYTGTVTSADTGADTVTVSSITGLENYMAISFSVTTVAGLSAGTVYHINNISGNTFNLYIAYDASGSPVNITGSGTGTFTTFTVGIPKYFASGPVIGLATNPVIKNFLVDSNGRVWSDYHVTSTSSYWTYTGNIPPTVPTYANGNGLVYYVSSSGAGFLFVFSNGSIDYTSMSASFTSPWTYQWNPTDGTSAAYNANPAQRLKNTETINSPHAAQVMPDNKVYYTDANWIGRFYQSSPTTAFDPTNIATYTFDQTAVLPFTDTAQCIAPSGNNILIGGVKNVIYPWDTFSQLPAFPIIVAESNIVNLVTVNTNTYAFAGSRGRIYVTNGSQADLFGKIPDHLSGTVEPYFTWGGATSNKNQLYFSASVTTNGGVANNNYGGLWAIDLTTEAIRLVNKLSYGTYAGYATAIIPNLSTNPAGTGLYIGWNDGASGYGIDTTLGTPYTGSQAYIDYDLFPIGTFYKKYAPKTVEYKLSVPMVTNESVSIYYRLNFTDSYTLIFTSNGTTSSGSISDNSPVNFIGAEWVQLRAVLNSTASSPSYTRLREIRIK